MEPLGATVARLCERYEGTARSLLAELVGACAEAYASDGQGGMSGHELPRLELLRNRIVELGAVAAASDVYFDDFGSLIWEVSDDQDATPNKTVIYLDGHSDTVNPLREAWHRTCGVDPFRGLDGSAPINEEFLLRELEYIPPRSEWHHLLFGRGSADQLAGVVTQVMATKVLLELRHLGVLKGLRIRSIATIRLGRASDEEDNDGGSPLHMVRNEFSRGIKPDWIPDVVVITGQRGRTTLCVTVHGKSVHGSMPSLGLNPLEYGARILCQAEAQQKAGVFRTHDFLGAGTRTASWCSIQTPSDCAVPQSFTFKFDRRLTIGETAEQALEELRSLPAVAEAASLGFRVDIGIPTYDKPTWKGARLNNPQVYNAWVTPASHPAVAAGVRAFNEAVAPYRGGTSIPDQCRVDSWVFSTDGVGYVVDGAAGWVPPSWIRSGGFVHPPMLGIGPGREQHAHRIGEYVDMREVRCSSAMLTMFCATYRKEQ